jgi:antitoxin HicB
MLLNEMIAQRVRPADLARRMGIKPQEVNRIIDLNHSTKIDTVAAATAALGKELNIVIA